MGFLSHVIALLIAWWVLPVHAETIPATQSSSQPVSRYVVGTQYYADEAQACTAQALAQGFTSSLVVSVDAGGVNCKHNGWFDARVSLGQYCPNGGTVTNGSCPASYTCPSTGGWTLSGQTCTRSDCVAPQVRNATTGVCEAPPDPCASRTGSVTAWYSSPVGSPSLESSQYCENGCTVGLNPAPTGTSYTNGKFRVQQYTKVQLSYSCTNGLASAPGSVDSAASPPTPPKTPPCAATEGVLTSSSGTIACVPPGTPASAPPIVDKKKKTESFPDGSTKTEETITTRDPQTGVEDKRTTTTNTPASSGSPGQAGAVGTSTSSTTGGVAPTSSSGTGKEGDTSSDFCQKNPNLQICKGDMNKEETQIKVKDSLETAFKTDDVKNDEITNAAASEAKKQEATDAYTAMTDKLSGGTEAAAKQSEFRDMFDGWFEPIPPGSCSPLSFKIGAYNWSLDPCPEAEKISALAGYALWIYLAFGVLALVTKKAE